VIPIRVRRYLFAHYTPETLLNHVFEDLRTPKVSNNGRSQSGVADGPPEVVERSALGDFRTLSF
jgi:hypothetical protein